eukprot:2066249-Amphidinium_carterae.1
MQDVTYGMIPCRLVPTRSNLNLPFCTGCALCCVRQKQSPCLYGCSEVSRRNGVSTMPAARGGRQTKIAL